jgi:hypothetical protein
MNSASADERRRHPRIVVDVPVRITIGHQSAPGRLRDICRDAALVELHRTCTLGEEAVLSFELAEEDGPIQVSGTVIRIAETLSDAHAVAFIFGSLQPAAEGRIDMFLSRQV